MTRIGTPSTTRTGWSVAAQTGAALAAAMGVGRFVFTPVLPLMEHQAHLLPAQASALATGNYLGYLLGALLGIVFPLLSRARVAFRIGGVVLVATLAAMPLTESVPAWIGIRGVAGVASAVVFMVAGNTILTELTSSRPHLVGWAYGGIGAGIAASGILISIVGSIGGWETSWWSAAALTALLLSLGWFIGEPLARGHAAALAPPSAAATATAAATAEPTARRHRWFIVLAVSYFFEGAGYIVAGTFLVAAVTTTGPAWLAHGVWTIVGLAAVPSCALWIWLSGRVSRPSLIAGALILQAIGIALPALSPSAPAAVASALLFGATFVGITTLSLAAGRHLRVPRAVAILTAGYGIGQVLGPVIVAPTLSGGYRVAMLVGALLVLAAGIGAGLLRIRFPHDDQPHRGSRHGATPAPASAGRR